MNASGRPVRSASVGLVGRALDLEFIRSHLHGSPVHGAALLLSGDAGIGKTALLDAMIAEAVQEGTRVLRADGVQFEAEIGYAGLNQLLVPLFDSFDRLAPVHRDALRVAVGVGGGPPPGRLLVCTATLLLLRLTAEETPLLVVADDLPWMDQATASVLGFVARRLVGSRISFLAAARQTSERVFETSALTEHRLEPLDDASSARLLAHAYPGISPAVRRRITLEARGNPLALAELSAALDSDQRAARAAVPSVLPLGERLQKLFAARVADLPDATRELLLTAALSGSGDLATVEAAVAGRADVTDLGPAERERLVDISAAPRRLSFRHPLVGSAVGAQATAAARRRAHQGLADVLTRRPERRAWHLGEATTTPDETVASQLEQAARLRLRRGDALGAVAALTRAAALSPAAADQSRRLAEAAYIGADASGELADASRLLTGARQADPGGRESLYAAAASAFLLINEEGDLDTAHRLLVEAIEGGDHGWDASDSALVEALFTLATLCWYSAESRHWQPFFQALDRLVPQPPDLLRACAQIYADPVRTGSAGLQLLDALLADVGDDPTRVIRIGMASVYADRLAETREASLRLVEQGRTGVAPVRRRLAAQMHLCLDYYASGQWTEAVRLADEGMVLVEEHGYRYFACKFQYIQALVGAARGDVATSTDRAQEIAWWAASHGARGVHTLAGHARALAALSNGDFESAYRHMAEVSPPGTIVPHTPGHVLWGTLDLVEAAVRTGREAEAAAHVTAVRRSTMAALSPRLEMLVLAGEALTTPGGEALALFEQALTLPGEWPFEVARVHLVYGERLRRRRATREAREHLVKALEGFEGLGALPWAARARGELRASGLAAPATVRRGHVSLTPQEQEIARLATRGLTNKQIAERLFLSHRTIGTHLYQIYRKLGISSRTALSDALTALDPQREGG
ncbi:LuxR family transcriptional regulator [Streptomyces sp. E5N91]|uniref:LuxR C-terminal-related transcriptional regulator n=1 Tax=Streptomyces sp. E5N91 TaxID=1851996 RepID=UPI001EE8D847|nr:LuxR family transcriptional regulator [Streptomyces sp. E5N91]